ncbi:glycosyltransferase family 4 protein [Nereida sp. MMG024]|nr:glycosyltransferase family 4 protein [Nereida sp. MMG025]
MSPRIDVITPHMKRRQTGVTTSFKAVVPLVAQQVALASYGTVSFDGIPHLDRRALVSLPNTPRIWHARRNNELIAGLAYKWLLRRRLNLVFTYAKQSPPSWITRFLMRRCAALIAVSPAAAERAGLPCTVIPHGINVATFTPASVSEKHDLRGHLGLPQGVTLLGCFGRLREDKGTGDLIDALAAVLPDHPQAHVVLIGAALGKHDAFVQAKLETLKTRGLLARIHLIPEVPATQIAAYYRALDLYVAPSWKEGFGLTVAEAMACALPVIATKTGYAPELIAASGQGQLVNPRDVGALGSALASALSKPAGADQTARRSIVDQLSIEAESTAITKVYKDLLP